MCTFLYLFLMVTVCFRTFLAYFFEFEPPIKLYSLGSLVHSTCCNTLFQLMSPIAILPSAPNYCATMGIYLVFNGLKSSKFLKFSRIRPLKTQNQLGSLSKLCSFEKTTPIYCYFYNSLSLDIQKRYNDQ